MKVSIHALFSSSSKPVAKLISCSTAYLAPAQPPTSHTALLVNERWVHESTGSHGVSVLSYDKWAQQHTEIARIALQPMEYQQLANEFRQIKGRKYDYCGVLYLALCIALHKFFGIKIPKRNKWESAKKYFCCEALGKLTGHYYGMKSPIQILAKLRKG